jgi:hypothetical protein
MNQHLNVFNNYREYNTPIENNLTRAFIITLKNEPQLLRDFIYLVNKEYAWDDINVSIQERNVDVSGFQNIIGVAITSKEFDQELIDQTTANGADTPIPDFLIYNNKTLIIGEVKKHDENPIAQLKNQVEVLLNGNDKITPIYRAFSWTEILAKLVMPYLAFNKGKLASTSWSNEFKDYISIHYSDWLPVPTLDKVVFTVEANSINRQFIEKRLYVIQSLTKYGEPQYWADGRMTMAINLGWATEAMVSLDRRNNKDYITINIWPGDTKSQGNQIFSKDTQWINEKILSTSVGEFELINDPYIKFSHVMGKWIGAINFAGEYNAFGKQFHNRKHFEMLCWNWDRSQWPKLESILDKEFSNEFDWREEVGWDEKFKNSGRNFVFISMGFECNIFIPFQIFKDLEKIDATGRKSANLLEEVIDSFKNIIDK